MKQNVSTGKKVDIQKLCSQSNYSLHSDPARIVPATTIAFLKHLSARNIAYLLLYNLQSVEHNVYVDER